MQHRIGIAGPAAAAALVAGVGLATGAGSAGAPELHAYVGDPAKIVLTEAGKPVRTLRAGTYTIVVRDASSDHDFHLKGPGVDERTSVSGKGMYTWKVRLSAGTYTFVCDPHSLFMRGSFKVL